MALPRADPATLPLHVLFPDEYEASKREITHDFVFFGTTIVLGIVVAALAYVNLG